MIRAHRDRTHRINLPLRGPQRSVPCQDQQRSHPREGTSSRPGPEKGSAWPLPPFPLHSPALWNHTRCAPSRCSDLGVSGLRNPGSNLRPSRSLYQGRQRSRGHSSPSPGPRQRTGKPERKGKGRGLAAIRDAPLLGIPSSQAALRPFFAPSHSRGQRWGRESAGGPRAGEGARRA